MKPKTKTTMMTFRFERKIICRNPVDFAEDYLECTRLLGTVAHGSNWTAVRWNWACWRNWNSTRRTTTGRKDFRACSVARTRCSRDSRRWRWSRPCENRTSTRLGTGPACENCWVTGGTRGCWHPYKRKCCHWTPHRNCGLGWWRRRTTRCTRMIGARCGLQVAVIGWHSTGIHRSACARNRTQAWDRTWIRRPTSFLLWWNWRCPH